MSFCVGSHTHFVQAFQRKSIQTVQEGVNKFVMSDNFDWGAALEESKQLQEQKWAQLPKIKKGFYVEHDEVKKMSEDEARQFRENNNNIVVSLFDDNDGFVIPKPAPKFEHSFHNHPKILEMIKRINFQVPSPIQAQSWPVLLQGKDLIGIAQTGTGKTLAYLLPGLISLASQPKPRPSDVAMLVLAPVRELAQQIECEFKKFTANVSCEEFRQMKAICVYGGGSRRDQIQTFKSKPEVVIATPGRLNDLTFNKVIDLTNVHYVVLDEADRMLDMGFEPQIRKIMSDIRPDRQTVMMSATWPPGVRRLASKYMQMPAQIYVGSLDLAAVSTVSQEIVMTEQSAKRELLFDFVKNRMRADDKAIVFVGRKAMADDISSHFALSDIDATAIHGDRDQADREQSLRDFKSGIVKIIVATDIASRGLDIDDVTYILNYDFPSNAEEYVHRVGRTGRAGRSGKSVTFFTREDWRHAQELIDILSKSNAHVPNELAEMASRYTRWLEKKRSEDEAAMKMGGGHGGRGRRNFDGARNGDRQSYGSGYGGGGGGGGGGSGRWPRH